jgi:hypothetical protein
MKRLRHALLASVFGASVLAFATTASAATPAPYSHVLLISVDGMHAIDLQNYIIGHPSSTFATLSQHAVIYPGALTTFPSDSFPGMLAQVTGGTPYSTGIFYDDTYDRVLFPAGSNCSGPPGTETNYAEPIDKNQNLLNAGGQLGNPLSQIDPKKLPLRKVTREGSLSECVPVYPHQFQPMNTIFEAIKAAGGRTAWSDKHPAYEILNGPSGKGIDDLFTPEINSLIPIAGNTSDDNTTSFLATQHYDQVKVEAVLNEIDGYTSTNSAYVGTPVIFGMNFQAVSVGQKLAKSGLIDPPGLVGGYKDAIGTPANGLAGALDYVDGAIGSMVDELKKQGLYNSTLIIISAKHGQSPIDRRLRHTIPDTFNTLLAKNGYAFDVADDVALIWLDPSLQQKDYNAAAQTLTDNATAMGIETLLTRPSISTIFRDPFHNEHTPDFIGIVRHGVIYTTGSKLAEHGGDAYDDRNVALIAANPRLRPLVDAAQVQTTQIAPTILKALGLDPNALHAVQIEGTEVLPDLLPE